MVLPQAIILFWCVFLGIFIYCLKAESANDIPSFGKAMKEQWFTLNMEETLLNHGSYGASPIVVQDKLVSLFKERSTNPDKWFQRKIRPMVREVAKNVAKYINADEKDVVMVPNASTAVNAVLRSLNDTKTNTFLYVNFEYGMTKKTMEYVKDKRGWGLNELTIQFPTNKAKIINAVATTLKADRGKDISFCVFDGISSAPAVIMPIEELAELCHNHGAPILIDCAHCVGQIPLDMKNTKVDFLLSNFHKWMLAPPGAAFLWVDPKWQPLINPTVISHWYKEGYAKEFGWTGTRSWLSILAISETILFRKLLTDEAVHKYNNQLCASASQYLIDRWNTSRPVPLEMTASITNVLLPCNSDNNFDINNYEIQPRIDTKECYTWTIPDAATYLVDDNHIWSFIYELQGRRYLRLSCQIYNEFGEYEKLAKTLDEFFFKK